MKYGAAAVPLRKWKSENFIIITRYTSCVSYTWDILLYRPLVYYANAILSGMQIDVTPCLLAKSYEKKNNNNKRTTTDVIDYYRPTAADSIVSARF